MISSAIDVLPGEITRARILEGDGVLKDTVARYFFMAALCGSLFVFFNWLSLPLTDQHAYRQTQTAISTYWLIQNHDWLTPWRYETPNVGYPWRTPLEFPVYQWVVGGISVLSGLPLEITGRLVSMMAFYGLLVSLFLLVKDAGGDRRLFFLLGAALLASPLYLFWSRTFMIESTALSLSLAFLASLNRFLTKKHRLWLAVAVLTGLLGSLTKVTTFAAFGLAATLLIARCQCSSAHWRDRQHWLQVTFPALLSLGLCLVAILIWSNYSEAVKAPTVFGKYFVASALKSWYYGAFSLKFSSKLWLNTIWLRAIPEAIGGLAGVIVCITGFILSSRKLKILIAVLLGLFLVPFLVFTNLHVVHNYYQCSAAIFLVAVLGLALHTLSRRLPVLWLVLVLAAVAAGDVLTFRHNYLPFFERSWRDYDYVLGKYLKTQVKPGQVLVMFGADGSSVIPYYAQCKALTIPTQLSHVDLEFMLRHLQEYTGGCSVGAVMVNGTGIGRHAMETGELLNRIAALKTISRVERHGYFMILFPNDGVALPPL